VVDAELKSVERVVGPAGSRLAAATGAGQFSRSVTGGLAISGGLPFRRQMRLRTTLVGVLVIVAIVLSATVYAGFALHKGDVVESERTSLNATAESLAGNLDTRIDEKRTMVRLVAANPGLIPGVDDWHSETLVERFVERTSFDGASVVDERGIMTAIEVKNLSAEEEASLVGGNYSHRLYVQRALDGVTYVGRPVAADSGYHVMPISAPIRRNDRVVGAITGTLHLQQTAVFRDVGSNLESGQTVTIKYGGEALYRTAAPPENALVATAGAGDTGWAVTVHQDRDRLQGALLVATGAQLGAVGVAILAVAVLGVWISRTTIGNVRSLIQGLTRLEEGDYDHELELGPMDEWQQIDSQFDSLANTLDQRESQLRVLNRVLRHNLRNDMSVVIAHSESLLQEGTADPEKVEAIRRTAYDLVQTSGHARAIYEDLLRDGPVDRRPVDLVEIVESDLEPLREDFPESRIETDLPDSAMVIDGDTVPVVVDELARNALVHNDLPESERELSVEVDADPPDVVHLVVRDNGPGLPAGEQELLTGERKETPIEHGSGLGLWVVNWLVTRLGGDVGLRQSDGRGSTVTVTFPAADGESTEAGRDA